eukprot:TRINITY_DN74849_c0_g1_i1.p1 TRINITY_DN74849_c0_g1~~TRINITY_DN74849_c0_g1_i1.p1  ORF type:complete len:179 (-),score=5.59 TRINITY_DN74849_c0_g1_i1:274-810(-)
MRALWGKYVAALESHPFSSRLALTSFLYGTGDLFAQLIQCAKSNNNRQYDPHRTLRMTLWGAIIAAPFTVWYRSLDRFIPGARPSAVLKKTCLDQFLLTPLVYVCFFPYVGMMTRMTLSQTWAKMKRDYWRTYSTNCGLWIPANLLNFAVVPSAHRVGFVAGVLFLWSIFLATVADPD